MKSFDQTFSKVCAGRGRAALVASAEAKCLKRRFWFFLRQYVQKERREFSQCIPQQYTPSQALGTPRAPHIPLCRRHLYILHKTYV